MRKQAAENAKCWENMKKKKMREIQKYQAQLLEYKRQQIQNNVRRQIVDVDLYVYGKLWETDQFICHDLFMRNFKVSQKKGNVVTKIDKIKGCPLPI